MSEDDLISDEREFSDEQNKLANNQSVWGELGYEDVGILDNAHSKRSREMTWEYHNQWD